MRRGFEKKNVILLTCTLNCVAQHLKFKVALCVGEMEQKHSVWYWQPSHLGNTSLSAATLFQIAELTHFL